VNRRDFIALFSSAATWPLALGAQKPPKIPRVGYLGSYPHVGRARRAPGIPPRAQRPGLRGRANDRAGSPLGRFRRSQSMPSSGGRPRWQPGSWGWRFSLSRYAGPGISRRRSRLRSKVKLRLSSPSMTASPVCTDPGSWPWLPTAQPYAADPRTPTSVPPQRSCTDTAIIIEPQGCNIRSWGFLIWRRRLKRIATRLGTVVRQTSNAHRIALSGLASMRRAFLVGPIVTTALRPDPWAPN